LPTRIITTCNKAKSDTDQDLPSMSKIFFLLVVLSCALARQHDTRLIKRAFRYRNLLLFKEIFSKYNYPSNISPANGQVIYNEHKQPDFVSTGKSSILINYDKEKIFQLPSLLKQQGLISGEDEKSFKLLVDGSPIKTIRETIFIQSGGDLIYGLVGIVKLTDSISVFTVFQNHRLTSRLKVLLETEGSCTLWNVICESQFKFKLPEDDDISAAPLYAANLLQFFRKSALDGFNNYSEPHEKYLQEQSD